MAAGGALVHLGNSFNIRHWEQRSTPRHCGGLRQARAAV